MNTRKRKLRDLQTLSAAERAKVLYTWNDTAAVFPDDKCLHQLFEAQVEQTPNAIAVIFAGEKLTYHELNTRANSLAHYLIGKGIGPESLVGVSLKRSAELIVALLAILKAGAAYVPLDPELPDTRLAFMLDDIDAPALITHSLLAEKFAGYRKLLIRVDADEELWRQSSDNPVSTVTPDNAIYAIYTSGSTGKPKGVVNIHRALVNRLVWMRDRYLIGSNDRILHKTPFSFDVSVWELFLPLISGARLVMAKPDQHRDPEALKEIIKAEEITVLHFVPSLLSLFLDAENVDECKSLRYVFSSGEALSWQLQEKLFARVDCELINFYGPTEAAIDVSHWQCVRSSELKIVPLGRPIANTQLYVLDANL
jgi:amino acid adenylation domain-containing protein